MLQRQWRPADTGLPDVRNLRERPRAPTAPNLRRCRRSTLLRHAVASHARPDHGPTRVGGPAGACRHHRAPSPPIHLPTRSFPGAPIVRPRRFGPVSPDDRILAGGRARVHRDLRVAVATDSAGCRVACCRTWPCPGPARPLLSRAGPREEPLGGMVLDIGRSPHGRRTVLKTGRTPPTRAGCARRGDRPGPAHRRWPPVCGTSAAPVDLDVAAATTRRDRRHRPTSVTQSRSDRESPPALPNRQPSQTAGRPCRAPSGPAEGWARRGAACHRPCQRLRSGGRSAQERIASTANAAGGTTLPNCWWAATWEAAAPTMLMTTPA